MTSDTLPPHLERIGQQLTAAARERSSPPSPSRVRAFRIAAASTTGLAVVAAATVLALGASTGAAPAYALTQNPDGSITVTINDLETAVPELNARFAAMGIDETVVPVEANCPAPGGASPFQGAPLFVAPHATQTQTLTLTPGHRYLAQGYTGVLAAEQLPDGEVAMAVEAIKPPVPSCFPPTAYRLQKTDSINGIPTYKAIPVDPTTTSNPGS